MKHIAVCFALLLVPQLGIADEPKQLTDLPYGTHPRQVLDFYQAKSDKPTPVVFYIHGGGWQGGDKKYNPKPFLDNGISVVAINYRYQLLAADARVSLAPRVSLLIPTGSAARGLGSGALGGQVNLPLSVKFGSSFVSHWNAGLTAIPDVTTYNLGGSVIWLASPVFNILCEAIWLEQNTGRRALILNPGIRWAHNFASGLQIVPGVAYGVGLGPSRGEHSAFFYLSFEHRFQAEPGRN